MIVEKSGKLVGLVIALRYRHFMGPAETVTTERSCDDEPGLLQSDVTGDCGSDSHVFGCINHVRYAF
jgi:hypothetical protein